MGLNNFSHILDKPPSASPLKVISLDKERYRKLLALVNDKHAMQLLAEYAQARIEIRRDQLEHTLNAERFREGQGALAELRRLLTLADEVRAGAK